MNEREPPSVLLRFCEQAQRLGVSQREAARVYRSTGRRISSARLSMLWRAARAAESALAFRGVA